MSRDRKTMPFYLYRFITYEFQHSVFAFLHRYVVQQHDLGHPHVNQNHKRSAQIPQWNRSRKILSLIWFHPTGYAHTSLIEFLHVQSFLGPVKDINLYMIFIANHRALPKIVACCPFWNICRIGLPLGAGEANLFQAIRHLRNKASPKK